MTFLFYFWGFDFKIKLAFLLYHSGYVLYREICNFSLFPIGFMEETNIDILEFVNSLAC